MIQPMTPNWTPLSRELDRWEQAGLSLPLWWRDDDAVSHTAALEQLTALSEKLDIPVHLAVIPSAADATLADWLQGHSHLIPVVHGWAHHNHAPAGHKKAEFGDSRRLAQMHDDAGRGLARLREMFGDRLRPLFVPPWNRIAPDMIQALPDLGFTALSTFTPRKTAHPVPGLAQINTHLDPIAWKTTRSLVDPDRLIAQIATQLADRREGRADRDEPYGLLTHHLVHDAAIWDFTTDLLTRLLAGPVHRWETTFNQTNKDTTP